MKAESFHGYNFRDDSEVRTVLELTYGWAAARVTITNGWSGPPLSAVSRCLYDRK
jgi:hypothetical protein